MKLKRLVTSLNASFEDFVSGVENHEAVADGAIAEVRKAAARLRVKKGQLEQQTARLVATQGEQLARQAIWQKRAREQASSNPEQAMECLRRRDGMAGQLETLTAQISEQRSLAAELGASLTQVETRVTQLLTRRTQLASREARASVLTKVATPALNGDIEALFERWEEAVLVDEYREAGAGYAVGELHPFGSAGDFDELDATLASEEQNARLAAELAELQNQENR